MLCCSWFFGALAQSVDKMGMISLRPYLPQESELGTQAAAMMTTKLNLIASANGMSGEGADNRFIITAHLQEVKSGKTQTIPLKYATRMMVGIFVGDGINGTLFSQHAIEVNGIGNDKEDAIMSAIRKINVYDPQLVKAVERGKARIVRYYDQMASNLLRTARSAAAAGHYDEALNILFTIPSVCKDYATAQDLLAKYGETMLEEQNMSLIRNAWAAWSANPTKEGAEAAIGQLDKLSLPSPKVQSEYKKLTTEISTRLKELSDRRFRLDVKRQQDAHALRLATIRSAASVARAYAASRPQVVYQLGWW